MTLLYRHTGRFKCSQIVEGADSRPAGTLSGVLGDAKDDDETLPPELADVPQSPIDLTLEDGATADNPIEL